MERSIREEARRLRQGQGGGEAGAAGAAAAGRKNVDLESLAFVQGAHFNSSKQCTLPQVCGGGQARSPGRGTDTRHGRGCLMGSARLDCCQT